MAKFKVDDRVVINDPASTKWKGVKGTIRQVIGDEKVSIVVDKDARYGDGDPVLCSYVEGGSPGYCTYYTCCVSHEISVPTDEELADAYREFYRKSGAMRKELTERGYTLWFDGVLVNPPLKVDAIKFKKTEVKEV